jgi:hypothetical protein
MPMRRPVGKLLSQESMAPLVPGCAARRFIDA